MEIIRLIIELLLSISASVIALLSILLFLRLSWPAPVLWILKLYTSALSLVFAFTGILAAVTGLVSGSVIISLIGVYDMLIYFLHVIRVTRAPGIDSGFEQAYGLNWESRLNQEQKNHFLKRRSMFMLPKVVSPRMEQNVVFASIPGTDRKLLCDIWQAPENITPSGLAFIYLHGSAWYLLDKDLGTRPFFGHLAAQGHVIMDVAYRLAPETDMMGMISDVKKAVVWMKENALSYRVNPGKIILGGGSAGGQLALMAAYTANNSQFTPSELVGKDTGVCSVISLYGPADLKAMYYHTRQDLTTREIPGRPKKTAPTRMPLWLTNKMGNAYHRLGFDKNLVNAGAFAPMFGGHPDECPETYSLFSPLSHVHADCPPSLLIHGEHDILAPVKSTEYLHTRLLEKQVKSVLHIFPQTDHAFDLQLPKLSPSAHNAFYDVEHFMALQLNSFENPEMITNQNKLINQTVN